jgi:hypothetical protein
MREQREQQVVVRLGRTAPRRESLRGDINEFIYHPPCDQVFPERRVQELIRAMRLLASRFATGGRPSLRRVYKEELLEREHQQ